MNGPHVGVLPVPEGSIVWLHNIEPPPDAKGTMYNMSRDLLVALVEHVGHDQFVILTTAGEGVVDVLGPEDLVARVRAALTPEGEPS